MPNYKVYNDASAPEKKGVAVTGTNTYYSDVFAGNGEPFSVHIAATQTVASLTGTVTLWRSNDPDAASASDTGWVQDTTFPTTSVSGTGSFFITGQALTAQRVRLKYVNATGSGTLAAWVQTAATH